jgi:hypothetical protein
LRDHRLKATADRPLLSFVHLDGDAASRVDLSIPSRPTVNALLGIDWELCEHAPGASPGGATNTALRSPSWTERVAAFVRQGSR